jgi:hypothetical protein
VTMYINIIFLSFSLSFVVFRIRCMPHRVLLPVLFIFFRFVFDTNKVTCYIFFRFLLPLSTLLWISFLSLSLFTLHQSPNNYPPTHDHFNEWILQQLSIYHDPRTQTSWRPYTERTRAKA